MKPIRICAILAGSLALAGCVSAPAPVDPSAVVCNGLAPITYSREDTRETRDQITEFNAWLAAFCA